MYRLVGTSRCTDLQWLQADKQGKDPSLSLKNHSNIPTNYWVNQCASIFALETSHKVLLSVTKP